MGRNRSLGAVGAAGRPDPLIPPPIQPPVQPLDAPLFPVPWAALAVWALVLTGLQFSTAHLIGVDSAFHIRFAQVVREGGLTGFPPAFPWMPLTILSPDRYADHHMLYHVFLVPFTLGDLRIGAKVAAIVGALIFVSAFAWVLQRERVPHAWLGLLALGASSGDFLFRLGMTRVQALSLACLFLGFHFALAHRVRALAILSLVYTWLYDGFPLLIVPVGAVVVAELVTTRRLRLGIVIAALGGMLAGLILNPYFPEYLQFMVHHFGDKLLPGEAIRIGREWLPYTPITLIGNGLVAILYLAFGTAVLVQSGRRADRRLIASVLVGGAFLILTLRSKRFIEYFAPAATFAAVLAGVHVIPRLSRTRRTVLALLLAGVVVANVSGVAWAIGRKVGALDRYADAARLVEASTPAGAMLCTTDWDDFPLLYYYNVHNTYLVGLDPTYLRDRFRDVYWQWVDLTRGRGSEPSRLLGERLPCAYVLSDRHHAAFLEQAAADPGLIEVLADEEMVLFRVRREGPIPVHPTTVP